MLASGQFQCCVCGAPTELNETRRCNNCIRAVVDITEGIPRTFVLGQCRTCKRYNGPPWTTCEWESKPLLAMCLRKIKGLSKRELENAQFIFTDSNSKRIQLELTVRKEVADLGGSLFVQSFTVEGSIVSQQCDDCKKSYTPHTWNACVQVRQKVKHRKTLLHLEQLIIKHNAQEKVSNVAEVAQGFDFHFQDVNAAQKFKTFIMSRFVSQSDQSKHLVSHDAKNNTYYNKHTINIELCPVCKDDLVYIPRRLAQSRLGGCPSFLLCERVTETLHLIDPFTLRTVAMNNYWKAPVHSVLTHSHLTKFLILNVELVETPWDGPSKAMKHDKFVLAQLELAREADFGANETTFSCRTHLGHVLQPGDWVLGYEVAQLQNLSSDPELDKEIAKIPCEAFIVRKTRAENRHRPVLKKLAVGADPVAQEDEDAYMQELEDDDEMKTDVNNNACPDVDMG